MARVFKASHAELGPLIGSFILLPYGYSYNEDYLRFKQGDQIKLFNGGKYEIISVCLFNLKDPGCDAICNMRYGIGIKRLLQIWKKNAVYEGYGPKAISEDECLIVRYK